MEEVQLKKLEKLLQRSQEEVRERLHQKELQKNQPPKNLLKNQEKVHQNKKGQDRVLLKRYKNL